MMKNMMMWQCCVKWVHPAKPGKKKKMLSHSEPYTFVVEGPTRERLGQVRKGLEYIFMPPHCCTVHELRLTDTPKRTKEQGKSSIFQPGSPY